jgi:hypothetical protein
MKCENCVFLESKLPVSFMGTFYFCKLQGIEPTIDCVYFKEKEVNKNEKEKN